MSKKQCLAGKVPSRGSLVFQVSGWHELGLQEPLGTGIHRGQKLYLK